MKGKQGATAATLPAPRESRILRPCAVQERARAPTVAQGGLQFRRVSITELTPA